MSYTINEYVASSTSTATTKSLGWVMTWRNVPGMPKRRYVIDDIPYQSGRILVGSATGSSQPSAARTMQWEFTQKFDTLTEACAAIETLCDWAEDCYGGTLVEYVDGAAYNTYADVALSDDPSVSQEGTKATVTLTFTANS